MAQQRITHYGVRYGDGEIEGPFVEQRYAEMHIKGVRSDIAAEHVEADDYEPMTLVTCIQTIEWTPWVELVNSPASEPCCDEGMTCLECDPDATFAEYADPIYPPGVGGSDR